MTTRPAQAPAYLSALPSVFLSSKSKSIFAVLRGPAKRPTNDIRYQEGNGVGRVGRTKRQWYQMVPPDIMAPPHPRVGTGERCQKRGCGRGSRCPGPASDRAGSRQSKVLAPTAGTAAAPSTPPHALRASSEAPLSADDARARPSTHSARTSDTHRHEEVT